MTAPASGTSLEDERAYLLDMIQQLARLARSAGESEVEILLRAILEVARASARRQVEAVSSAPKTRR